MVIVVNFAAFLECAFLPTRRGRHTDCSEISTSSCKYITHSCLVRRRFETRVIDMADIHICQRRLNMCSIQEANVYGRTLMRHWIQCLLPCSIGSQPQLRFCVKYFISSMGSINGWWYAIHALSYSHRLWLQFSRPLHARCSSQPSVACSWHIRGVVGVVCRIVRHGIGRNISHAVNANNQCKRRWHVHNAYNIQQGKKGMIYNYLIP